MAKYGMAHEHYEHVPLEYGCILSERKSVICGSNRCCFFCPISYKCQEERRCNLAWFSRSYQPNPAPFHCKFAKTINELTWDLIFNGTDSY